MARARDAGLRASGPQVDRVDQAPDHRTRPFGTGRIRCATRGIREAIAAAVRNEDREIAESRWYDAFSSGGEGRDWAGVRFGNRLVDSRKRNVDVGPKEAFAPIRRIGGETGWYAYSWLWRVRGFLDSSSEASACAVAAPCQMSCMSETR